MLNITIYEMNNACLKPLSPAVLSLPARLDAQISSVLFGSVHHRITALPH